MSFRYYNTTALIFIILFLALGIDKLIQNLILPYMQVHHVALLRAPGNVSLIGMFLFLYDKVLWKWPVFNLIINLPDMRGRYTGKISYSFSGVQGEKECAVEITQTSSRIKIHAYFNNQDKEKTKSKSLVESVEEEDGFYNLYLYYFNSGSKENNTLDCHEGANMLKFIPADGDTPQKLIGHYFTDRKIQTRGAMEVKFETKKLKGTF